MVPAFIAKFIRHLVERTNDFIDFRSLGNVVVRANLAIEARFLHSVDNRRAEQRQPVLWTHLSGNRRKCSQMKHAAVEHRAFSSLSFHLPPKRPIQSCSGCVFCTVSTRNEFDSCFCEFRDSCKVRCKNLAKSLAASAKTFGVCNWASLRPWINWENYWLNAVDSIGCR